MWLNKLTAALHSPHMGRSLHKPAIRRKMSKCSLLYHALAEFLLITTMFLLFFIQLIVLELYHVLCDAVENINFEKRAILVSSMIPFHTSV